MKILKYENRKSDPQYWDMSTPEAEKKAIKELFEILCYWQIFNFDDEDYSSSYLEQLESLRQQLLNHKVHPLLKDTAQKLILGDNDCGRTKEEHEKYLLNPGYGTRVFEIKKNIEKKKRMKELYKKAKSNDVVAIRELLDFVRGDEYCNWEIIWLDEEEHRKNGFLGTAINAAAW